MTRYKHRRPTRTDRLLLWAKDRLTAFALRHDVRRRRVEPMADWEQKLLDDWGREHPNRLDEQTEKYGPDDWPDAFMEREGITTNREFFEVIQARHELDSVESVVGEWGQR